MSELPLEPSWSLLVSHGHLTIWRGDYFALLCKIVPGNRERIVDYVEQATHIGREFCVWPRIVNRCDEPTSRASSSPVDLSNER